MGAGVGVLAVIPGCYDATAARDELTSLLWAAVVARIAVLASFASFVALDFAPAVLIVSGLVDAVAARWMGMALVRCRQAA